MRNRKIALVLTLALLFQCFAVAGLASAVEPVTVENVTASVGGAWEGGVLDLSNVSATAKVTDITVTLSVDAGTLVINELNSTRFGTVSYSRSLPITGNTVVISAADLVPSLDGLVSTGDVTLANLRGILGGQVVVMGNVNDTPVSVTVKLGLGNTLDTTWATVTYDGSSAVKAEIKRTVLNQKLSDFVPKVSDLVAKITGTRLDQVSLDGSTWYNYTELVAKFPDSIWEGFSFGDLVGKSMQFKLDGGKSYTLTFTKQPEPYYPPVDPGGGGTVEPPLVTEPTENEAGQTVHEVRATAGLIPDIVTAKFHGKTSLTLDITAQLPEDEEVAVLAVQIPKEIVKSLAGLDLVLNTPYSNLVLPTALIEALAADGEGLDLTIQPGDPEAVQAQIEEYDELLVDPVEIITSIAGSTTVTLPCNLVLPEDVTEREAFLASLYVLAIHGEDDLEQLVELEFNIGEETNTLLSISFQVERFSTFAIVAAGEEPEEPEQPVKLYTVIDSKAYTVNEDVKAFDNLTAYRANDTTTVMAVRLLQELGAQIGYKRVDNVGVVTVIHDDITVTLREKSKTMTVVDATGERQVTLRAVFTNLNGRTYLPTRDVAENLGFFVHWAAADDSITITSR